MSTQFFTRAGLANMGFDAARQRVQQAYDTERANLQNFRVREADFQAQQAERLRNEQLANIAAEDAASVPEFQRLSTSGLAVPETVEVETPAAGLAVPPSMRGASMADNEVTTALTPLWARLEQTNELPSGFLRRMAEVESSLRPDARNPNSTATGLFQFLNTTAQEYGINPLDPEQSSEAAARLATRNRQVLRQQLGRDPSPGELYLAHQQGANGAARLLDNPQALASTVVGRDAVANNGGDPDSMTAGEFASMWIDKFEAGATGATAATPAAMFARAAGVEAPAPAAVAPAPAPAATEAEPAQQPSIFGSPELDQWPVITSRMPDQTPAEFRGMRAQEGSSIRRTLTSAKGELTGLFGLGATGLFSFYTTTDEDLFALGFTGRNEASEITQAMTSKPVRDYFTDRPGLILEFDKLPTPEKVKVIRNILNKDKPVEQQIDEGAAAAEGMVIEISGGRSGAGLQTEETRPAELSQEPSPQLNRVYLDNPDRVTRDEQRLMTERQRMVNLAQRYAQVGGPQGAAAAMQVRQQIDAIDQRLYYMEGMRGINQFRTAGDPRLIQSVWGAYTGQNIQIIPRTDGLYNINIDGQLASSGASQQEILTASELAFSEQARNRMTETQMARAADATKFFYESQLEQVKIMGRLQEAVISGNQKMAVEIMKQTGVEPHNDSMGNVYFVSRNPLLGPDVIYKLEEGGIRKIGGTDVNVPPNLQRVTIGDVMQQAAQQQ